MRTTRWICLCRMPRTSARTVSASRICLDRPQLSLIARRGASMEGRVEARMCSEVSVRVRGDDGRKTSHHLRLGSGGSSTAALSVSSASTARSLS